MHHFIPVIWEAVRADVAAGRVVNIDEYCRKFSVLRPDLDWKGIQDAVLEAVSMYGGNASWGDQTPKDPPGT